MHKYTVLVFAFYFCGASTYASANSTIGLYEGCGEYSVIGKIKLENNETTLIVFEKSLSETRLVLEDLRSQEPSRLHKYGPKISRYDKQEVKATLVISTEIKNYKGKAKLTNISLNVPDFLNPNRGQGFWIKNKLSCKKLSE